MKILGFPVQVRLSFFLVAILMSASRGLDASAFVWVATVFVSVLLHELGHALVARRYGRTAWIELYALGGLTHHTGEPLTRRQSILVSLAGPGAGLALGALVYGSWLALGLEAANPLVRVAVFDLLWANVVWSVLNLAPMLPLDGGHVMQNVLSFFTKSRAAPLLVSVLTAAGLGALAYSAGSTMGLILLAYFALPNVQGLWQLRLLSADAPLATRVDELVASAESGADLPVEELEDIARQAKSDELRAKALHLLAWEYHRTGRHADARAALDGMPKGALASEALSHAVDDGAQGSEAAVERAREAWEDDPDRHHAGALAEALARAGRADEAIAFANRVRELPDAALRRVQATAFNAGRYEESIALGERLFRQARQPEAAYNIACACAKLGRADDGAEWLGRAVDAGFSDRAFLEADADLAPLRASPRYAEALRRLPAATA